MNWDVINLCLQNNLGAAAFAGNEEYTEVWSFDAAENGRMIWFKGLYIAIYNETTMDVKEQVLNSLATIEYTSYKHPRWVSMPSLTSLRLFRSLRLLRLLPIALSQLISRVLTTLDVKGCVL
jgi:hypothetical protein